MEPPLSVPWRLPRCLGQPSVDRLGATTVVAVSGGRRAPTSNTAGAAAGCCGLFCGWYHSGDLDSSWEWAVTYLRAWWYDVCIFTEVCESVELFFFR